MIQYLLKSADFSGLFRFISPSFFKVVSPQVMFQIGTQILRNQKDLKTWEQIQKSHREGFDLLGLNVGLPGAQTPSPRDLGHRTLELFFYQILTQETWIVDLRTEAFEVHPGGVDWKPKAYYFKVQPQFLEGVRSLYRGFYLGDDALFDSALKQLKMDPARESFRAHFGLGDQSSVMFRLKEFQNTFTHIFDACAKEGNRLQGDFFVLGVMLVGLYERLETLNVPMNARACFDTVAQKVGPQ